MKVYLEEKDMPKSCHNCCFECDSFCCINRNYVIDNYFQDTKHKNCPLKSLTDHDKKVRKEVCEDIRKEFKKHLFNWYEDEENVNKELYLDADWLWKILDQIQGDYNAKNK